MSEQEPSYQFFRVTSPTDFVVHVEINRPGRSNAFIEPMWLELRSVFEALSTDSAVRCIVLSGAGEKAFTTGLDVQAAGESGLLVAPGAGDAARKATAARRYIRAFQDCISSVERCEKPVICVLHGYAFGLAIDLSCAADIRICSNDTKFAVKEIDIGLAADIGTLTRLPKVVGNYSWVKDVCLSARIFGAQEAEKVGFVSNAYPGKSEAVSAALTRATLIAGKSPVAVQGTKNILDYSRDHPVEDGLKYTTVWNGAGLQTTDIVTAIKSQVSKRKPTFEKL